MMAAARLFAGDRDARVEAAGKAHESRRFMAVP